MLEIKEGDDVRDKTKLLNGGAVMGVIKVKDGQALCDYFKGPEMINKQIWVDTSELECINYENAK